MHYRNKTPSEYIYRGLYLYFSGFSLRRTSQIPSCFIKRNHVTICNWIQKHHPRKTSTKSKRISKFILDEIMLKVGSEYIWLWVANRCNKQGNSRIIYLQGKKHAFAERFMSNLIKGHGRSPPVSTDRITWYPMACRLLKLKHHFHSPL
jgi:putative transposase